MSVNRSNLFSLLVVAGISLPAVASADLSIKRDNFGVPAVRATTNKEMFFGAGYAMARDRLGQMTILRSVSQGDLPGKTPEAGKGSNPNNVLTRSRYPNLDQQLMEEIKATPNFDSSIVAIAASCIAEGINQFLKDISLPASKDGSETANGNCYNGPLKKRTGSQISFGDMLADGEIDTINLVFKSYQSNRAWTSLDVIRIFQSRILNVFSATNEQLDALAYLKLMEQANPNNTERARRIFNSTKWVADPNAATEIPVPSGSDGDQMRLKMAMFRDEMHGRFLKSGQNGVCPIYSSPDQFAKKVKAAPQTRLAATEGFPNNASNFWAETGSAVEEDLTAIVFNGPQTGAVDPSIFYQINVRSDEGFAYAGTTIPGTFFPGFGHNGNLALGVTAANNGSTDMFCIEVAKQNDGSYLSSDGLQLVINPDLAEIGVKGFYVKDRNWPVMLFDKNKDGSKAIAFVKRYSWQNHVISSFKAALDASQAKTLKEWNSALDYAAGNFNLVAAHKSGEIAFRLTGVIPPRLGTNMDKSKNPWDSKNYLAAYDIRLPVPMSPAEGWREEKPQYYKLYYSTNDGRITSWNHKPYLMMPDSDIIHASWFQWERAAYITEELNNRKGSLRATAAANANLSLRDVYFWQFNRFLDMLASKEMPESSGNALKQILSWSGYRNNGQAITQRNIIAPTPVERGQVLFQLWMQAFADRFQGTLLKNGSITLNSLWGAAFAKLKQPKLAEDVNKPAMTYDTSSNIHLFGRIILNNLHRVFYGVQNADPYAYDFIGDAPASSSGPIKSSQQAALNMMIAALGDAVKEFDKRYGEVSAKTSDGNLPMNFRSNYGVSTRMAEGPTTSLRKPNLFAPYFRNRGAQNHIVGFMADGRVQGYNEIPGGSREYRGPKTQHSDDQMILFTTNDFRPMVDLDLEIGINPKKRPTLLTGGYNENKDSKL